MTSIYEDAQVTLCMGGNMVSLLSHVPGSPKALLLARPFLIYFSDGLVRYIKAKCPRAGPQTRDGRYVPVQGYADDFKLLAKSLGELHLLLQAVSEWCQLTNMRLNCIKTHTMVFPDTSTGSLQSVCTYKGHPLQMVSQSRT